MKCSNVCGRIVSAIAIAALAASSAMAAHLDNPNLLSDSGFETAFVDDGSGVNKWQPFADGSVGNTSEQGTTMPRTDLGSAEFNLVNPNGFAGAFQDAYFGFIGPDGLTTAGRTAWFSGWSKLASGGVDGGTEIRIEWRDSVNDVEIARTGNLVPTLSDQYSEFVLSDVVPAGADTARVVYAIQSFGAGVPQGVFVDDTNFNVAGVPEPSTIALVGLSGVALLALRRRK